MSYIIIYFEDKPVFLCDEITAEIQEYRNHPETVFLDELSTAAINSLLHEIQNPRFHAGVLLGSDLDQMKSVFFRHFRVIRAAGGLVKNIKNEILLIRRRGKWDLPKGKLEQGESLLECAVREVQEETGLLELEVGEPLATTYHTYVLFGKAILKESHWFAMKFLGSEKGIPQSEEDITEIKWVAKKELKNYVPGTYLTIAGVLSHA